LYDLLVIGGGINGVGIARDAAGRGLKVLLCEKNDLASSTSSASSKLIHGGLRYLESYEFKLVRHALAERETLLNIAPHIIWSLRFVLPVEKGMRPAWMLRIGLFLYDHLAKRAVLPGTKTLKLRHCLQGKPLRPELVKGFEYSDCWADDARLVVINAVDAAERGATISTRTECMSLVRYPDKWTATLKNADGVPYEAEARVVVNAAGPWVDDLLGKMGRRSNRGNLRLVKGSHIVTRKLYEGDHAYIFQSGDGRVIFAIPYEDDYTLIGTTERDWSHDQGEVKISEEETRYLCDTINLYFATAISPDDVVWAYAGVRPLFDDQNESASVVTRDYVFDLDAGDGDHAPALSIFGGKLTTYRKLAEQAVDQVKQFLPHAGAQWTATKALPGGDFDPADVAGLRARHAARWPWLTNVQINRMTEAYGTRLAEVIGDAASPEDLGHPFGAGLYEREVRYLMNTEFAGAADDILWRRSKLGLRVTTAQQSALKEWMALNLLQ
jgi:glycerol-3-phosphate dehydrogenase